MRITLDQDQWDVSDDQPVSEALMQVSDRAHARQRLVTSLKLGGVRSRIAIFSPCCGTNDSTKSGRLKHARKTFPRS